MGRRETHEAFVAACDRFVYVDLLSGEEPQAAETKPKLKKLLSAAIRSTSKDDGWSHLGEVGNYLVNNNAAFDPRDYGHAKLGELVRAMSYVEVKQAGPTGLGPLWVRLR